MEEESRTKNTAMTESAEFLGDVDEHKHLSDREEDDEVPVPLPNTAPVATAESSGPVGEDVDVRMENDDQYAPTDSNKETSAASVPLSENNSVHESFQALEELQRSLPGVGSAPLDNEDSKKSSLANKQAQLEKFATKKPAGKVVHKSDKGEKPRGKKLPRVASLQNRAPQDASHPPKTKTKTMRSLPRVASLQKSAPGRSLDPSSANARPTKKMTGLPRVAMLQRPTHHPAASPHHSMSKQQRDLMECQKKFKAKPLPKSLYSGTKTPSTLNPNKPEYMKPTRSFLAKIKAPVTEQQHNEDSGTPIATAVTPRRSVTKTSPSAGIKKKTHSSEKTSRKYGTGEVHDETDDEIDEILGAGDDDMTPPTSKKLEQESSPDDVQTGHFVEDATRGQADTSMEPTKLDFD